MTKHLHERRGLSFAEFGALLATRELIDRGHLRHRKEPYIDIGDKHIINMAVSCATNDYCGTVGCIGGTMALIMGKDQYEAAIYVRDTDGELNNLFHPPHGYVWGDIKPNQMVAAIDNFIARGKPGWKKILGKPFI